MDSQIIENNLSDEVKKTNNYPDADLSSTKALINNQVIADPETTDLLYEITVNTNISGILSANINNATNKIADSVAILQNLTLGEIAFGAIDLTDKMCTITLDEPTPEIFGNNIFPVVNTKMSIIPLLVDNGELPLEQDANPQVNNKVAPLGQNEDLGNDFI